MIKVFVVDEAMGATAASYAAVLDADAAANTGRQAAAVAPDPSFDEREVILSPRTGGEGLTHG
jgi:hypothetical protein